MKKLTIALLSGGISAERKISLESGDQVYNALDKKKYRIIRYDPKTDLDRLVNDAHKIDAAFIALHGPFGEDGTLQGLLELLNIPYQSSGVLGSALAMNKLASKEMYQQSGLLVPSYNICRHGEKINPDYYINSLGLPLVIKPVIGGSSLGMNIIRSKNALNDAVKTAFDHYHTILIETYIKGTELTCGVIGNDMLTPLPVIEIIFDKKHTFFDYSAKYNQVETQEICPARLDDNITDRIQQAAQMAHKALYCNGYSRTDMILAQKKIYVLETNTIPGMTPASLLPLAARTAGITFDKLLDKLIELGIARHKRLYAK